MASLLDHPLISNRYFFPREEPLADPFWVESGQHRLACYLHQPHPGRPTVIHFHGNGEVVADYMGPYVGAFESLGLNCLLAEYRGYGSSSGVPCLVNMLDDVGSIVEHLGVPIEKLFLFGRSIGSIYAIHGASLYGNIAGLILESGIADVKQRLILRVTYEELGCTEAQFDAEIATHLNHREKLAGYKGPILIMHTRHDGLVELSHAQRNHTWAAGPKRLKIFENGNHNTIIGVNAPEYFQTIGEFTAPLT